MYLSCSSKPPDETIFSSGVSHITVADKLIEMVQYMALDAIDKSDRKLLGVAKVGPVTG